MRYAMGLEYDGSAFLGWQVQRQEPTVQACVEQALAIVANHEVRAHCCGRTDTGVHAVCQVVHFDALSERDERSWVLGVNSHLPAGISVLWVKAVDEEFHARFSAFARTYQYRVLNRWIRPALEAKYLCWYRRSLDATRMHLAAQSLLGEHDFSAFRAAGCQANHAIRAIHAISVQRLGNRVILDVTANGFLYHMVRNIVGNLLAIGSGEQEPAWLQQLLDGKDRTQAAATAPAQGLYFMGARYPDSYALPGTAIDFPEQRVH